MTAYSIPSPTVVVTIKVSTVYDLYVAREQVHQEYKISPGTNWLMLQLVNWQPLSGRCLKDDLEKVIIIDLKTILSVHNFTSQSTMPIYHVLFVIGILLISAQQKIVKQYLLLKQLYQIGPCSVKNLETVINQKKKIQFEQIYIAEWFLCVLKNNLQLHH